MTHSCETPQPQLERVVEPHDFQVAGPAEVGARELGLVQQNELRAAGAGGERRFLALGGGAAQILELVVARVPAA